MCANLFRITLCRHGNGRQLALRAGLAGLVLAFGILLTFGSTAQAQEPTREVLTQATVWPYTAVVSLNITYPDGTGASATGTVVE
jgi:hypothetical protein